MRPTCIPADVYHAPAATRTSRRPRARAHTPRTPEPKRWARALRVEPAMLADEPNAPCASPAGATVANGRKTKTRARCSFGARPPSTPIAGLRVGVEPSRGIPLCLPFPEGAAMLGASELPAHDRARSTRHTENEGPRSFAAGGARAGVRG